MSIQVRQFDKNTAENELKKCPKIVRDYVKLLKENSARWQELTNKAIAKLKEQSKKNDDFLCAQSGEKRCEKQCFTCGEDQKCDDENLEIWYNYLA